MNEALEKLGRDSSSARQRDIDIFTTGMEIGLWMAFLALLDMVADLVPGSSGNLGTQKELAVYDQNGDIHTVLVPVDIVDEVAGGAGSATAIGAMILQSSGDDGDSDSTGRNNPLLDNWGEGSRGSAYNNANYHYEKHGTEVGANSFDDYLRKANAFKNRVLSKFKNPSTAHAPGSTPNTYRYRYDGKYVDLEHIMGKDYFGNPKIIDYKIISYGVNKIMY